MLLFKDEIISLKGGTNWGGKDEVSDGLDYQTIQRLIASRPHHAFGFYQISLGSFTQRSQPLTVTSWYGENAPAKVWELVEFLEKAKPNEYK